MTGFLFLIIILLSIVGPILVWWLDEKDSDTRAAFFLGPIILGLLVYLLVFLLDRLFYKGGACDGGVMIVMILAWVVLVFGLYLNILNLIYKLMKKIFK